MPTQWSTFPVEFKGGLISNMSPLQQGMNAIGSATILQNMESDRQGGYTKIRGYQKFSTTEIPGTGTVLGLKVISSGRAVVARKLNAAAITSFEVTATVNGATTSSTSVLLDGDISTIAVGTVVTGTGITGTVTVVSATETTATADVAAATTNSTALTLDGNSGTIVVGMTVTGSGISGTVTVATVTDQNNIVLSSAQTLAEDAALTFSNPNEGTIVLSSAQTLADDTVLTFQKIGLQDADANKTAYYVGTGTTWTHMATSAQVGGGKVYKASFNFDGDDKTVFVDGLNYPGIYNSSGNTMTFLTASSSNINTDVQGAELVTIFKNTAFYAKGNTLYFTAPFTIDNFSAADGAGSISVGNTVTGLIVFREQLIIFTKDSVQRLVGNTSADFNLQPISDKIGCLSPDSVQEYGGDVMYLAPDGLRLLSATDRIGDFALDVTSDKIYKDSDVFLRSTTQFCSVIIREKAQYRIFAYISSLPSVSSEGLVATKFIPQGGSGVEWSTTKGIKAYIADSVYSGTAEAIMFANEDGYLYEMEQTNGFDGENIETIVETPYMAVTDPEIRKTAYKLTLYTDPTGQMDLKFRLLFDFDSGGDTRIAQPEEIDVGSTTGGGGVFIFGTPTAVYGGSGVVYGSKLKRVYNENLIGSFHTVAMRITSDSTNPPFTLDSAVLQYRQNDRQ